MKPSPQDIETARAVALELYGSADCYAADRKYAEAAIAAALAAKEGEIARLEERVEYLLRDRDTEKRMRKDSDDYATTLREALAAKEGEVLERAARFLDNYGVGSSVERNTLNAVAAALRANRPAAQEPQTNG